jgi:hypothetical protein
MPNFVKISPVGAESHADSRDERADMTKLIVVFRNFANAPKNITKLSVDVVHRHSSVHAVSYLQNFEKSKAIEMTVSL